MLTVLEINNPFDMRLEDVRRHSLADGLSIRGAAGALYPGFTEFEFPTLCLVNSEPRLRSTWDEVLPENSVVSFVRLAGEPVTIIIAIIVIVVAVVVAVAMQNPAAIGAADAAGEQRNGATVYSLSGERNQNRLNSSIEAAYGRNRLYPSYAARPYNTYDGNQQFQYSLFCLGHGSFKIEKLQFEDSPLTAFDDVEFEIVEPGQTFDLFADNVTTASSVANIELFGTNEPEFAGAVGPFVANAPFTLAHRLEVDISLPSGLYKMDEENDLQNQEVAVQFQYQKINDEGQPIGAWTPLVFSNRKVKVTIPSNDDLDIGLGTVRGVVIGTKTQYTEQRVPFFSKTMKTLTPQRFTLSAKVAPGRYQVKAQRMNKKNTAANSANQVRWESLRAYLPSVKKYGAVTLIAIKARATNNLNNNAAQRFNVIATRKLPTWTGTAWTAAIPTRNPVWAFVDIFKATYGGRLPDALLDLVELKALADTYQTAKIWFDYIYDQKTTVWEAARAVCRVGRGVPMLNGSQITIVRDALKTTATHVFNQHNIVGGSFTWEIKLRNIEDNDGVEIEYLDAETWQPETVLCLIGEDLGDNPESIKLPGCNDRTRAYQEGLYIRATQLFAKENITFRTGLEGHLPRFGDLILVSHDVPRWGTGGLVESYDGNILTLNEPVTFTSGAVHKVILRKKDGSAYGPVTVTAGADAYHIVTQTEIPEAAFYFDDTHERPIFLFGIETLEAKRCTVIGLSPEADDTVMVKCVGYDERVYSYAGVPTPDKYAPPRRVIDPEAPVVASIRVAQIPGTSEFVQVSWPPALGAKTYIVDQSTDAVHWTRISTLPSTVLVLRIDPGTLYLRVAGVNVDVGPFAKWQGYVGVVAAIPGTVLGLSLYAIAAGFATLQWTALANTDSYELSVFEKLTGKFLRHESLHELRYTYTLDMGDIDGLVGRTVLFRIKGMNIKGVSADAAVLTVTIPERPAPIISFTADNAVISADNSTVRADHT